MMSTKDRAGTPQHAVESQLRMHAHSPRYLHQPQASRLLQYCVSRGDDRGPIGRDFGGICDQIDRADVMLAGLRDRVREGTAAPEQAWPDTDGPQVLAVAKTTATVQSIRQGDQEMKPLIPSGPTDQAVHPAGDSRSQRAPERSPRTGLRLCPAGGGCLTAGR
jgi:hypothetical protein